MTEPYTPQVGHRVRRTRVTEGVVTYAGRNFAGVDGLPVTTYERLPDSEPKWQPGDIVIDADSDVLVRTDDSESPWQHGNYKHGDDWATRPLTRLIREIRP